MATRSDDPRWGSLIDALRLMASPPARQAAMLTELSEIAGQIRRGEAPVELIDVTLTREGVLPAEVGFLIQRIDEIFDGLAFEDPAQAFTEAALAERSEWRLMRGLARGALEQLGVPLPPMH
ncbi:MAG: hypothetical protein PVI30_13495 [Myxococcales bacterium]|jgi:hypothetical protein